MAASASDPSRTAAPSRASAAAGLDPPAPPTEKLEFSSESPRLSEDEPAKSARRSLVASLGIAAWPHSDAALTEALRVKAEHERTKQEFFRFESHKRVLEILEHARHLRIPGSLVAHLFSFNDEQAKAKVAEFLASQPRAPPAAIPEEPAAATSLPPPALTAYTSPRTPGRPGLHSPISLAPPAGTPGSQPPAPAPPTLDFSTPKRDGANGSPDRFVRGHRATVSALPTVGSLPVYSLPGQPLQSPQHPPQHPGHQHQAQHPAPAQHQPPAQHPTQAQLGPLAPYPPLQVPRQPVPGGYYPPQLVPPQFSGVPGAASPGTVPQQPAFPAGSQTHSPIQPQLSPSRGYGDGPEREPPGSHQPLVPVMSTMSARSSRARGHQHSLSTGSAGSDLQIHQWKPKQLLRDNRWKYPNPYSKHPKERRAAEDAGDRALAGPPAKQQVKHQYQQYQPTHAPPLQHPQQSPQLHPRQSPQQHPQPHQQPSQHSQPSQHPMHHQPQHQSQQQHHPPHQQYQQHQQHQQPHHQQPHQSQQQQQQAQLPSVIPTAGSHHGGAPLPPPQQSPRMEHRPSDAGNDSITTDAGNNTSQFNDSVSSLHSVTSHPPVPPSPINSAAVVAAAHNSRRRGASHVRRRSAAAVSLDSSYYTNDDLRRRDEGVAALASLAADQPRANHTPDSVSGESASPRAAAPSQKLPSLLQYLENKAGGGDPPTAPSPTHPSSSQGVPGPVQPNTPGSPP